MKQRSHNRIHALTQQLSKLDEQTIDRLYGLEPVFEPGENKSGGAQPTQFVFISCPYCGEQYETQVDLTAGSFTYVEDCQVCCQPMELSVEVNEAGELHSVVAHRQD